jgi:hypothetical protein
MAVRAGTRNSVNRTEDGLKWRANTVGRQSLPADTARKRAKCIKKFLYYFPGGYSGKKFVAWEREYKFNAHIAWKEKLGKADFARLLQQRDYYEIAKRAITLESKTNLLFSFEKMAIRDALKTDAAVESFATGLFDYIYGKGKMQTRFENYRNILSKLPVKQTRVLTWPLMTVFGFLADPVHHIYLKPTVTKKAAEKYRYDFFYKSQPNWQTYQSLLLFAELIRNDTLKWKPRDMIDLQSFIWVMGSDEYPD